MGGIIIMKKWQLISTTVLGSALVLGACSDDSSSEEDSKEETTEETKQEESTEEGSEESTEEDSEESTEEDSEESTEEDSEESTEEGSEDEAGSEEGASEAKVIEYEKSEDAQGTVTGGGSSTVAPIMEKVVKDVTKEYPGIKATTSGGGSGAGFEKLIAGEYDFSNASRPIKDEEKKQLEDAGVEFTEFKVANDGVTVAVNKENDFVDYLTFDELKKIFSGEAKTWKDVREDFPEEEIKVFGPDQAHGTYDFVNEEILEEAGIKGDLNNDTNVAVTGVKGEKNAVAFFGYNFYLESKDDVKAVPLTKDGKSADEAVEVSGDTIESGEYPLSRPLFVYANNAKLKENPGFQEFLKFAIANSPVAAQDSGYVPLKEDQYKEQIDKIDELAK